MHTFRLRIGFEFQTLRIRGSMTSFMRKVSIALETNKCYATSEHFPFCGHTLYTYILVEVKRSSNGPEVRYRTFSKKEHRKRKRSRTRLVGEREWSAGEGGTVHRARQGCGSRGGDRAPSGERPDVTSRAPETNRLHSYATF